MPLRCLTQEVYTSGHLSTLTLGRPYLRTSIYTYFRTSILQDIYLHLLYFRMSILQDTYTSGHLSTLTLGRLYFRTSIYTYFRMSILQDTYTSGHLSTLTLGRLYFRTLIIYTYLIQDTYLTSVTINVIAFIHSNNSQTLSLSL